MKKFRNIFSILVLSLLILGALTACGAPEATEAPKATEAPMEEVGFEAQPFGEDLPTAPTTDIPLVVAYQDFSQKFSPFFSDTGYDADVASMTQISVLTTDRTGGIIFNAIEGETVSYNGTDYLYKGPADIKVEYDEATDTTKYTARLRVGMQFSDGVEVTIDDLIFSYYTFLDPTYVGSTSLSSFDIIGLNDYRTQTTSDVFEKYNAVAGDIYAAGVDHEWSDGDAWTQEQQDGFWAKLEEEWVNDVAKIVAYVNENYSSYAEAYAGIPYEEIGGIEGMEMMFGMFMWGFGDLVGAQSFGYDVALEADSTVTFTFDPETTLLDIAVGELDGDLLPPVVEEVEEEVEGEVVEEEAEEVDYTGTVNVTGSWQAAAGYADDWDPTSAATALTMGDDGLYTGTFNLPAGDYAVKVALDGGAVNYGVDGLTDGEFVTAVTETSFDLVDNFPTLEDYYNETYAAYGGDPVEYAGIESADGTDVLANVISAFIGNWGPLDESMGGEGIPNIAGIVKIDDYTVEVTVNGFSAPAVYSILGIQISPLHYYGDVDKYDYDNNMFGFDFGDLSKQESLTATPLGAGAYTFVRYDNRVVYFEANELYYRGSPKIAEIQFKETTSAEVPSAVQTGTADAGEMSYNKARFAEVASYNANGEVTGDIITMSKVDNLGYGYIGLNALTINVAGDPGSEASKNMRKGFATVLAVYRDVGIDSYYGEGASVINYPISNTSWAAPQPTDDDYKIAFSTDVNGDPIYNAEMTYEERYAAAEVAALVFFEAAGFTVEDGKLTAAPVGAKLTYEVIVPGDGTGDHPAFAILTDAQAAFANIGMELTINDPADSNILWDALDAQTQELWTAAWGSTIDPDMYQVYHSSSVVGAGGSESNHYYVVSDVLDQLILDARMSDDQSYRKIVYKQALEELIDWAVEIPNYQRKNAIIFSTERLDIGSLTPDITTFWGWLSDIELVDMLP